MTREILLRLLLLSSLSIIPAIIVIIMIGLYVYVSLAYMAIAKRTGTKPAWLAWIPALNYYLISKIAGMGWWPMLFLLTIIFPILKSHIKNNPVISALSAASLIFLLAFTVYSFIWLWKTFRRVNRPGWWVLMDLIPIAGPIIYLTLLGVAAWSKDGVQQPQSSPQDPVQS